MYNTALKENSQYHVGETKMIATNTKFLLISTTNTLSKKRKEKRESVTYSIGLISYTNPKDSQCHISNKREIHLL